MTKQRSSAYVERPRRSTDTTQTTALRETITRNDLLRTTLRGGVVLFSRAVMELDARIRGRLIDRITRFDNFHADSLHDEGTLIFAGFSIVWYIDELDGKRRMHVILAEDIT